MSGTMPFADELGDASEVYNIEPRANSDFRLSGTSFDAYIEELCSRWLMDEIYGGKVYIWGLWDDGAQRRSAGARFDPDNARELGLALLRAAEYAERQTKTGERSEDN